MIDLEPAAAELTRLIGRVGDDELGHPTPCREWDVAGLLAHIHQFAYVFTMNARKAPIRPPNGLVADWSAAIPAQLDELARAWRNESAWQGRVSAGGIEMDAAHNGVVAIEELTVHGWDLARAIGQPLDVDDEGLDQVERFFELFGAEPFGPPVPVTPAATRLARTIARTGRDPRWTAPQ